MTYHGCGGCWVPNHTRNSIHISLNHWIPWLKSWIYLIVVRTLTWTTSTLEGMVVVQWQLYANCGGCCCGGSGNVKATPRMLDLISYRFRFAGQEWSSCCRSSKYDVCVLDCCLSNWNIQSRCPSVLNCIVSVKHGCFAYFIVGWLCFLKLSTIS